MTPRTPFGLLPATMPTSTIRGRHLLLTALLAVACGDSTAESTSTAGTTSTGDASTTASAADPSSPTTTTSTSTSTSADPTSAATDPTTSTTDPTTGDTDDTGTEGDVTPCWPFDQPPLAELRAADKKVFAHYFSPYPLSLDNKDPAEDYYAKNYLEPEGENGKFAYCGGFIKERPLPQPPREGGLDYELLNFEQEVRRAAALGLDGFTYDILNTEGTHWNRLLKLLDAASNADPEFRIVLMPDMTSTYQGSDPEAQTAFVDSIVAVAAHPAVYRLGGGELVLAPFAADKRSPAWWAGTLQALAAAGVDAALWPVFVSPWEAATISFQAELPLLGTSSWGPATVPGAADYASNAEQAHALGVQWMSPVRPQDSRPKDLIYSEAGNTQLMRSLWDAAVAGDAEWVQLVTWNDYSEASEVSPSSGTQWALFDLTAYYVAWFKTGQQPPIVRDAIYYSHRLHATAAQPDLMLQESVYEPVNGSTPADEIELLAFLTAPATLEIEIAGEIESTAAPAGIQSLRVPLVEGTPKFRIVRDGSTVAEVDSAFPISNAIVYQDMLYRSGGSLPCDRAPLMQ
ncbi:glycoside hydrolase family 71 protein [Nannocystis punicea]|uniref:Glycoside hydrolase family 71 protein n=1 Tax=Nannocystis punicea TaxID=2995304 RepID=A0ABY7HGI0_9BACT|nr:glycoside hydrolase family 71 protein [Nannocystis poenicansa]WAS98004.1 glycoside hydrolase family 71 protein [Nannocystis poenicansa]